MKTELPLFYVSNLQLVDFTIGGDFGGRGHRRHNGDLRPFHIGKPAGTLSFRNSGVVRFRQFLFGILDRVCRFQQ